MKGSGGGPRAIEGEGRGVETNIMKRARQNPAGKYVIAAHALREIADGSTIFIDHSTSSLALARQLERRPPKSLTLVTNSPAIASELHESTIHLVVTPARRSPVWPLISPGSTED